MSCGDYELILSEYALGEMDDDAERACRKHLERCAECRAALAEYAVLVAAVGAAPVVAPTLDESAALAMALSTVRLGGLPAKPRTQQASAGLTGLMAASLAAFIAVATVLALQVFGTVDVVSAVMSIGPLRLALTAVVAVFVTTFVPIAVTARRRPLNGLTFRR